MSPDGASASLTRAKRESTSALVKILCSTSPSLKNRQFRLKNKRDYWIQSHLELYSPFFFSSFAKRKEGEGCSCWRSLKKELFQPFLTCKEEEEEVIESYRESVDNSIFSESNEAVSRVLTRTFTASSSAPSKLVSSVHSCFKIDCAAYK